MNGMVPTVTPLLVNLAINQYQQNREFLDGSMKLGTMVAKDVLFQKIIGVRQSFVYFEVKIQDGRHYIWNIKDKN